MMNKKYLDKFIALKAIYDQEDSKISGDIELYNFMRLVDGDLHHIGDALIQGLEIGYSKDSSEPLTSSFKFGADRYRYTIKQQTRMIGDIEVPAPFAEHPENGQEYWLFDEHGYIGRENWNGVDLDRAAFKMGSCYKSKQDAISNRDAFQKVYGVSDE